MINSFMEILHTKVFESLNDKTVDVIKKKTQSLGIDIKDYHKQRLMFLISQHIAYYIDLHVQESRQQPKGKQCNINDLLRRKESLGNKSTIRNHSIHFTKAVYLHHYICGPYNIFKSVKFVEEMELQLMNQYQKEEITLEVFKENEQIKQLANERQFSCICRQDEYKQAVRCEKCMRPFHPQCQYQKILCNRCFLCQQFFPIDSTFFSKFGQRRNTVTYFHGKFSCFNPSDNKKSQLFAIKFDIDDLAELQNATEPEFIIKIMNFGDLSNETSGFERWKMLTQRTSEYSIFLNSNRFQFFLNFSQLKRKNLYFRNQNSLIFKVENRLPLPKDNILMIKCEPGSFQDDLYQIGIHRITKKKCPNPTELELYDYQKETKAGSSLRITTDQFRLLEKYSKIQNQDKTKNIKTEPSKAKPIKKDEEQDQTPIKSKGSNLELVRSYGCNHKEGFNLSQLKRNHLTFIDHNSKKLIKKPQLQKYNKNPVEKEIKKQFGRQQSKKVDKKKHVMKNRHEEAQKEDKKYMKFAKCSICSNHLSVLYLLPEQLREGDEMKIAPSNSNRRNLSKKKKQAQNQEEAKQAMLEMFRPRYIFRANRGKKEQESDSYVWESSESKLQHPQHPQHPQGEHEDENQNPGELLCDEFHRQVFEDSLKIQHIYSSKAEVQKVQENKLIETQQVAMVEVLQQGQVQVDISLDELKEEDYEKIEF